MPRVRLVVSWCGCSCIVNFVDRTIAYTKNGILIGTAHAALALAEPLYAAAGMRSPEDEIVVCRLEP